MSNKSSTFTLVEKEIKKEIMATDVYVGIAINPQEKDIVEVEKDIDVCVLMMRSFADRFSRFKDDNELSAFNNTFGKITVSDDLYSMLSLSKDYYRRTSGIFDISVYSVLLKEGYVKSSTEGFVSSEPTVSQNNAPLSTLKLLSNFEIEKPLDLRIELGGIGKGFIINKVKNYLDTKYENFIVDAGGDIYYSGIDKVNAYDYWACDIENPASDTDAVATLLLKDKAVATSGTNRRVWKQDGQEKHHIIDPKTKKSADGGVVSVTVVSSGTVDADILAKTLLIMGEEAGLKYANKYSVPALFINSRHDVLKSNTIEQYVWKA